MQPRGGRRQTGQKQGSWVRTAICLSTAALLSLITYWNVSFVYARSRASALQPQEGDEQIAYDRSSRHGRRSEASLMVGHDANDGGDDDGFGSDSDDDLAHAVHAAGGAGEAEDDEEVDSEAFGLEEGEVDPVSKPPAGEGGARGVAGEGGGGGAAKPALTGKAAFGLAPPLPSHCPSTLRPYHTLLTAQSTTYQNWQSRIMYYHFTKQQKASQPCTEMGGFTRLVAHKKGEPDGLEDEIPSVFVTEYTAEELARFKHFAVMNRPFSVLQMLANPAMMARITEEYLMIAETDHVLMRPLPNLATREQPAAYNFGYMHANAGQQPIISHIAPKVRWQDVQPIGPSPCILHLSSLQKFAQKWNDYSIALKLYEPADKMFGWVLEMWGYAIAAADEGVVHKVLPNMQCEPGAQSRMAEDYTDKYYIHHYTYGSEYKLNGEPQGVNQIGEWSLDKRHYGGAYPPRDLQPPPATGHSAKNHAPRWLTMAWNEASANIPTWPDTKALGTLGWRREPATDAQISASPLASSIAGSKWKWGGVPGLVFGPAGKLTTPWGEGKWGLVPTTGAEGGAAASGETIFVDFASALHNLQFDLAAGTFMSTRVGDGEHVSGVRDVTE